MTLTPKQLAFASSLEVDLIFELVGLVVAGFWYGMSTLFITGAAILYFQHNDRKWAKGALFGANILAFVLATLYIACRISAIFIVIDGTLVKDTSLMTLSDTVVAKLTVNETVIAWAAFMPALIIDGTLIRGVWALCQALYSEKRWLIGLPCLLWFGTFGTTLAYVTWLSTPSGFELYTRPAPTAINDLLIASVTLSNATNLVATSLFGWVFWSLYRRPGAALGDALGPTDVKNLLGLFIESGTLYLTVQLCYLGFMSNPPSGATARLFGYALMSTYAIFSATFPTVIVVLKELRKWSAESMLKTSLVAAKGTLENGNVANAFALSPLPDILLDQTLSPIIDISRVD